MLNEDILYPDLTACDLLAVDIETHDPKLTTHGTGVYRKDSTVLGVGISDGVFSEYYSISHKDVDPAVNNKNIAYLKQQIGANIDKVFANALYDVDHLKYGLGWDIPGLWNDVQIAEPLLNENKRTYTLDSLCEEYLNENKDCQELKRWCDARGLTGDFRSHIHLMPYALVRRYGKSDPLQTWKIFDKQKVTLTKQQLDYIYNVEIRGLPLYALMRKNGVRVDKEKMNLAYRVLSDEKEKNNKELAKLCGKACFNSKSNKDIQKLFDLLNIRYEYKQPTARMREKGATTGNPEFDKLSLSRIEHPTAKMILRSRHASTLCSYIDSYRDYLVGDHIHCSWHPLRGDGYGTVTGRLSCTKPNMQQASKASEEDEEHNYGKIIRSFFIPEEGCLWDSKDLSQIEYRMYAHYGIGESADNLRDRYNNDPTTDFHNEMMLLSGITDRRTVKSLNFGSGYGMGVNKMIKTYGWSQEYAEYVYEAYHSKVPFIKKTMYEVGKVAKDRGYIFTLLKRRSRLRDPEKAYIMFNHLIQGSAADYFKLASVLAYEAGVFDTLTVHLSVHDELNQSNPMTKEGLDASRELVACMENAMVKAELPKLKVPIIANTEIGESWGELKPFDLKRNKYAI